MSRPFRIEIAESEEELKKTPTNSYLGKPKRKTT